MSIDLDWTRLDAPLASSLVEMLNRQLQNTPRPSFIGPVQVTALDFGSVAPEIELVDLCDIYRDFLEDDEESSESDHPVKVTEGPGAEDDEGFEWVSRRAARGNSDDDLAPRYHHLPPHIRYGGSRAAAGMDMFSSVPALGSPRDPWSSRGMSASSLADYRQAYVPNSMYRSGTGAGFTTSPFTTPITTHFPNSAPPFSPPDIPESPQSLSPPSSPPFADHTPPPGPQAGDPLPLPTPDDHPNLQVHMRITWPSDLRITLTTSLLINYPSPSFMSLPIKLSVTGILFNGEIAVAYEGKRKRVHLCILDELDPYGPASSSNRPKREPSTSSFPPVPPPLIIPHNSDEADDADPGSATYDTPYAPQPNKPPPIGHRLLPIISIDSEIGQADKHALKNVTRVEKFIQDVVRKSVEEELVFPNFHTVVLGDS